MNVFLTEDTQPLSFQQILRRIKNIIKASKVRMKGTKEKYEPYGIIPLQKPPSSANPLVHQIQIIHPLHYGFSRSCHLHCPEAAVKASQAHFSDVFVHLICHKG